MPGTDLAMVYDRDSQTPLIVGAIVSLLFHSIALTIWMVAAGMPASHRRVRVAQLDQHMLQPERIHLGEAQPRIATVAWIPAQDVRHLLGPQSVTKQPSLQEQVDPVADAPVPDDPTLRAVNAPDLDVAPLPATAVAEVPGQTTQQAKSNPFVDREVAQSSPAAASVANPTTAPRAEHTVTPTSLSADDLQVQPGRVLVGAGIEITTARPAVGAISRLMAVGGGLRNVSVEIKFNRDGKVDRARLLGSTGVESIDSAVLASLYSWQAKGKRLALAEPHITITIDYRFIRSNQSAKSRGKK